MNHSSVGDKGAGMNTSVPNPESRPAYRRPTYWKLPPAASIMPMSRRIPSIFRRRPSMTSRSEKDIRAQPVRKHLSSSAEVAPVMTVATTRPSSSHLSSGSSSRVTFRLSRSQLRTINQSFARIRASFHTRAPRASRSRISPLMFRYLLRTSIYNTSSNPSILKWETIVPHPLLSRALSLTSYSRRPLPAPVASSTTAVVPSSASSSPAVSGDHPLDRATRTDADDVGLTTARLCVSQGQFVHTLGFVYASPRSTSTVALPTISLTR